MLNLDTIAEALSGLMETTFPGEDAYLNLVPKGFNRPSSLVELGPVQMSDASHTCVEVSAQYLITLFSPLDHYSNSDTGELRRRMMQVLELFSVSGLQVADRYLRVSSIVGTTNFDYAEIRLQLSYQDDRPGAGEWPLIGAVQTNIKGGIADGTA